MRTALVGHRGVGKTSLLSRIEKYFREVNCHVTCLDLDAEIEKRSGRTIAEIFEKNGEAYFREFEVETFSALANENANSRREVFFALGAGFNLASLPESWRALWIRRPTDSRGRIFLDRPSLSGGVADLKDFHARYSAREKNYLARANEILCLDEGLDGPEETERDYFLGRFRDLGGALTLMPRLFRTAGMLEKWFELRRDWGIRWFELRDDLLTSQQIESAARVLPREQTLLSFRASDRRHKSALLASKYGLNFDWALELGVPELSQPMILSLHSRSEGENIAAALAKFPTSSTAILKAALPVNSFRELAEGQAWQAVAPERRVFLPTSIDGRWTWYRLHHARSQPLGFFRDDDGSSADQPTLLQWARRRGLEGEKFAAVIGDPVIHSRTPIEQATFFRSASVPVYSIRVTSDEWRASAPDFLRKQGMIWAAVTSPHKKAAFEICASLDPIARKLKAVNTLQWNEAENFFEGANTDLEGFQSVIATERFGRTAVWGGGGTLEMLATVFPEAEFYSTRTGLNRRALSLSCESIRPDTLIWAAGATFREPPLEWKPSLVVDLSYTDDSPARAFALRRGSRYVSGRQMFLAQAKAQRRFWKVENERREFVRTEIHSHDVR